MEITQFTYFQEMGHIELNPVSVEITYGLGRIAMFIQKKESIFELEWTKNVKYGDIYKKEEYEFCKFNFESADIQLSLELFDKFETEAKRLMEQGLLYPGYDYALKCSHLLNILDARNAISPDERKNYIARIRRLANAAAKLYTQKTDIQ
jgi:glycyl-tRNA synthetase alpha chain